MCSRSTLQLQTMSPSTRPLCMASSLPRRSVFGTLNDLVVQQCTGNWDAKDANMASYRFIVQQLSGYFEGCEFDHVPRANNEAADALSKIRSTRQAIPPGVSLEHIKKPSIIPSPESESIFISKTGLEALKKAK